MSNVRDFGAVGNGKMDDTEAVQHAVRDGDGLLEFAGGVYLIRRTIEIDLNRTGRIGISGGAGTATIVMAGPGPAFHLVGTHDGTAVPEDFKPEVWARQRMPTVLNLEVAGAHPEADGFLCEGTMQSTFEGVLLRELRHGIVFRTRARNVIVSHCHIYNNRGCGIWLDGVNLHQCNIIGNQISYNVVAGIKMSGGEIRNFQITGNDIEYNYDRSEGDGKKITDSADVLIDCRPKGSSIDEGTIAGNTIQAVPSKGGANIRVLGNEQNADNSTGQLAISGNLIGSQETAVHLVRAAATVITGNVIYGNHKRNLLVEASRNVVIGTNSFDHNTDLGAERQLATGIRIEGSRDVSITGVQIKDAPAGKHTLEGAPPLEREGLIEIVDCQRVTMSGLHVIDGTPHGIYIENSSEVALTGSQVREAREKPLSQSAIRWKGPGRNNYLSACSLGKGSQGKMQIDLEAGVQMEVSDE